MYQMFKHVETLVSFNDMMVSVEAKSVSADDFATKNVSRNRENGTRSMTAAPVFQSM